MKPDCPDFDKLSLLLHGMKPDCPDFDKLSLLLHYDEA
jgi:hypothetical protein